MGNKITKSNESKFFLFTYGTLMKGQSRHEILEGEKFIQEFDLDGVKLYNYDDGEMNYPVILLSDRDTDIAKGEIYECDSVLIPYLNEIEGVGSLYSVFEFPLEINGKEEKVRIYVGINKTWQRLINTLYLKPYPNNTKWKPTHNFMRGTIHE